MEHIKAENESQRARIMQELQNYRDTAATYVAQMHPHLHFVHLDELLETSSSLINRSLFLQAMDMLSRRLQEVCSVEYTLLDPRRVWVAIGVEAGQTPTLPYFGGFYHHDQGYRYLQQIAIFSLSGSLYGCPVDRTLATLELIRSYTHDTLHHNTYRLFLPRVHTEPGKDSFYRAQYGISPRREDGVSYSMKDAVTLKTTRNLGNIMEAATDRFAHELVSSLAQQAYSTTGYCSRDLCQIPRPTPISECESEYIYRDCTGKLTSIDMRFLRQLEQGQQSLPVSANFQVYLKNMRLFVQYVNLRYQQFLCEFDAHNRYQLHKTLLMCMLSGDLEQLQHLFNTTILKMTDGFTSLFQSSHYLSPRAALRSIEL